MLLCGLLYDDQCYNCQFLNEVVALSEGAGGESDKDSEGNETDPAAKADDIIEPLQGAEKAVGEKSFLSLKGLVSPKTLQAIAEMGFTDMMEIQHRCIRPLLEGQ